MSLLLPQTRSATVRALAPVDIHGDRYVDVVLVFDGEDSPQPPARVSAMECPAGLAPGDRVQARYVMGALTRLARA